MTDNDRGDADISDIAKKYMRMLREHERQNGENGSDSSPAADAHH